MAFFWFEMLAACFAFVATVSGLQGLSGSNCFQFFDAMLAAMLFSGLVLEGHFKLAESLVSGMELVGRIALFSGLVLEGHFKLAAALVSGIE